MQGIENTLPTVEGLSPVILWYTLVGLVGIGALIILYDKVRDVFRKRKAEKKNEEAEHDGTIQGQLDKMSKQIDGLKTDINKKFGEYDTKFANDKQVLDMHTRQLNEQQKHIDRLYSGQKAVCRGILALLNHSITGNSVDKLKKAQDLIQEYLIDGVWPEDDKEDDKA